MKATLEKLISLDSIDRTITELKQSCCSIPVQIGELDSKLKSAKERVTTIKSDLKDFELKIRKSEKAILDSKDQQGKFRAQLFKLKSNREYQARNSEIEALKEKVSDYETLILELYDKIDLGTEQLVDANKQLKEDGAILQEEKAKLEETLKQVNLKLDEATSSRTEIVQSIPTQVLTKYDRQVKKGKTGVTDLVKGNCGGCNIKVRPQISATVRSNDQLVNCEKCGRFLYWSDQSD